jgi:exodeoxyribonuclease V alpha subunit
MITDQYTPLDEQLSLLVTKLDNGNSSLLSEIVRQLSQTVRNGCVCIDLSTLPETVRDLRKSLLVGFPGEDKLLILTSDNLLYFARYYNYEKVLADKIKILASVETESPNTTTTDDIDQQNAVNTALRKRFTVISGGPGTGKTWTAAQIIIQLLNMQKRIAVVAPTGKAANRLGESLKNAMSSTNIPQATTTLHRLLGFRLDGSCKYNSENPLPYDAVILDEASMVDLSMMCHLAEAIAPTCSLILLGDRHQLASVEAGSVMADICNAAMKCVVELNTSYRFKGDSTIGVAAKLVREGKAEESLAVLKKGNAFRQITNKKHFQRELLSAAEPWFTKYKNSLSTPEKALTTLTEFRILSVQHEGFCGTKEINSLFADTFDGVPIIVLKNDNETELYNGDTGIIFNEHVVFPDSKSGTRTVALSRIPEYSPAFALTVHKSQGSEYDTVHLILPEKGGSKIMSRELIYTALTRAKKEIIVWGTDESWIDGVNRPLRRTSGLQRLL